MEKVRLNVKLEIVEEMLGTAAADPELYEKYILSQHPELKENPAVEDETEMLPDVDEEIEQSTTIFRRDDEQPCLLDYQIKGFFKDACSMLRRVKGSESKKLKAYKKEIDGLVFVTPRAIRLLLPEGAELGICERPLRAGTAKGERIALARSESAPVGTRLQFAITLLDKRLLEYVEEWLEYGELRGLGQWRNSGKGRFRVLKAE